jgi:hypothetical protein
MSELNELRNQFTGKVTKEFLVLLLKAMECAFQKNLLGDLLIPEMKDFRRNLDGFEGRYLFLSKKDGVCAAAVFKNNDMDVIEYVLPEDRDLQDDWNIIITFKDSQTILDFLFSGDQDILNVVLANGVELQGNINYMLKFGFMAKDLTRKTGLDFFMGN